MRQLFHFYHNFSLKKNVAYFVIFNLIIWMEDQKFENCHLEQFRARTPHYQVLKIQINFLAEFTSQHHFLLVTVQKSAFNIFDIIERRTIGNMTRHISTLFAPNLLQNNTFCLYFGFLIFLLLSYLGFDPTTFFISFYLYAFHS